MIDYQKIIDVMCWQAYDDETPEAVFIRMGNNLNALPNRVVIDIVHAGGLQKWAESIDVSSQAELYNKIIQAIRKTISDPVFFVKKNLEVYPPLSNFFFYCQKLDRNGKTANEAEAIADIAWNGVICRRNLAANVARMFDHAPDAGKYQSSANKIAEIWGFTPIEIDALRYFVCQTQHENHNPSLNKNIYLWGKAKGTGKTTIARSIVTILNGDAFKNFGKYESTFSTEMAYNDHDLPLAALYNAVLLDESMPKDTKKSYGSIKRVLTSNSHNYNPKFRQIINVKCKRFYFLTSNDDITDFVQDTTERRFFSIKIEKKPEQLSFDEIYQIWYDFCTNATPEENWQEWYNSFDYVDGLEGKNIEEAKNEILLRKDEIFSTVNGTYLTTMKIAQMLFKNEPNHEQKKAVREAMDILFGECRNKTNKSYFSISLCREKMATMDDGVMPDSAIEAINDLPF